MTISNSTLAVRTGIESDQHHGAVVPPLHLSSNFSFAGFDQKRQYDYSRSGNPTRDLLAEGLAQLEGGVGAVVTSSGMSAITLVLQLLAPGATVVAAHDCYGGTWRLLDAYACRGQIKLVLADLTAANAEAEIAKHQPDLVWIETPSNPLLRITDISKVATAAHAAGAIVVADNTFLSPALQQPLALGADIVVHSTTKYINGHSDVVGGCVVAGTAPLFEQLSWWANCLGLTGAPFDSWLTLRGLRTLSARLRIHQHNALRIGQVLEASPLVARVYYPGLSSHPDHQLADRQQQGFGGMLSFELVGGEAAVRRFLQPLQLFSLAESLGGVESLIAHPATMTHAAMDAAARAHAGITDGLLRLSVGIEDADDLVADLETGLSAVVHQRKPKLTEVCHVAVG